MCGGVKLKRLRNVPGKKHAPNSARQPARPPQWAARFAPREGSGELPACCRHPGDAAAAAEPHAGGHGRSLPRFCRAAGTIRPARGSLKAERRACTGETGFWRKSSKLLTRLAGMAAACDPASHHPASPAACPARTSCSLLQRLGSVFDDKADRSPHRVPPSQRSSPSRMEHPPEQWHTYSGPQAVVGGYCKE